MAQNVKKKKVSKIGVWLLLSNINADFYKHAIFMSWSVNQLCSNTKIKFYDIFPDIDEIYQKAKLDYPFIFLSLLYQYCAFSRGVSRPSLRGGAARNVDLNEG